MKIIKRVISRAKWEYTKVKHFVIGLRARKYYKTTIFDYDPSFFKGKSIAIVGGADSVFSEKKGAYIDTFDIIIRVNRGVDACIGNEEYLGSRTDVLFHGLEEDILGGCGLVEPQKWKGKNIKKVVFPLVGKKFRKLIDVYVFRSKGKLPLLEISKKQYTHMVSDLEGFRPTTGFAAIHLISKTNYKKLYITGFTFFRTPYQKGYNDRVDFTKVKNHIEKAQNHNINNEYKWFVRNYQLMPNLEVDKVMKKIFETN